MRITFLLAIMAAGVFYSYIAFTDLSFMTRTGRLGPGFFPRIVGVLTIVLSMWAIVDELRKQRPVGEDAGYWRDVAMLVAIALVYAVLLKVFGGFLATILFLLMALSVLNPRRYRQNLSLAVIIPVMVYLLFDVLLNANTPPGLVPFPI